MPQVYRCQEPAQVGGGVPRGRRAAGRMDTLGRASLLRRWARREWTHQPARGSLQRQPGASVARITPTVFDQPASP